ncbi:hypothetical protein BJX63DRAFT_104820 [Aspergillus granulosus]|uniref:Uncharacterized protein n=1 Tax=Aspergillus granulosus TaxID=176169 RepID=A0ABR4GUW2_9EURO
MASFKASSNGLRYPGLRHPGAKPRSRSLKPSFSLANCLVCLATLEDRLPSRLPDPRAVLKRPLFCCLSRLIQLILGRVLLGVLACLPKGGGNLIRRKSQQERGLGLNIFRLAIILLALMGASWTWLVLRRLPCLLCSCFLGYMCISILSG